MLPSSHCHLAALLIAFPSALFRLRGYHTLWLSFPEELNSQDGWLKCPHLPCIAARDSVRPSRGSLAVTTRMPSLVSFPASTKMFQFPALRATLGLSNACFSPRHIAACHGAHHQSQAIHQMVYDSATLHPRQIPYKVRT